MRSHTRSSARSFVGRLFRYPLRLVPRGTIVPILSGPLRGKRWIVGSSPHGCWLGTYERSSQHLAKELLQPGDVVYDLGANVGFFTLLFSRLVGEQGWVVAFEPIRGNLDLLRRHLGLNSCSNVEVAEKAVGERSGAARFREGENSSGGHLDALGPLQVELTSLDHEVFELGRPAPKLIKLDVEGAELLVLEGARRTLKTIGPSLWIETHGWKVHEACRELLRRGAYHLREERETGHTGHGLLVAVPSNARLATSIRRTVPPTAPSV